MTVLTTQRPVAAGHAVVRRGLAAIFAAALGIVIVYATGFAPGEQLHAAAHDARHSFAFPCH